MSAGREGRFTAPAEVWLPRSPPGGPARAGSGRTYDVGKGGAGLRLLLLEDSPTDADLELRALARRGLSIGASVVCANRSEYEARLQDFEPDVILSDYLLPDIAGEEALRLALHYHPDTPFILVSGVMGEERAVDVLKQGVWDYVLKDRLGRLAPAIMEALQRARLERERREALEALACSEERLRSIVDTVQDGLSVFESVRDDGGEIVDFVWTHANLAAAAYVRFTPAELIGVRLLDLLPGLRGSALFAEYVRVVETGLPTDYLAEIDETFLRGTFEGLAARLGDGIVATYRDVTAARETAEALAASEQRLRTAIDSLLDPCVLLQAVRDESGRIADFRYAYPNEAACGYDGLPREELTGRRMLELLPGLAESGMLAMYARVVETGEPLVLDGFTYRHELRGGQPRQYDIRATQVGDGVCQTWRDVTDRHAAERALRESEYRFRSVVVALGEGIVVQDGDGRVIECNPAAERILGLPRSTLLGLTWRDERLAAVHENGSEFLPDSHPAAVCLRTGRPCPDVTMGVGRPGSPQRWILANAVPLIRPGESSPYATVTSFTDITDLRRAVAELEESEERFRLAFDDALAGMALIDVTSASAGRFARVNPALCDFLGRGERELLGRSLDEVTHTEDRDVTRAAFAQLVVGETASYRAEARYLHANGVTLWGLLSVALVRGRDGASLCALAQIEDVTARKRAEQDLVFRALHDDLTGLPNRALLLDHLAGALARAQRSRTRVGVLFIDLDNFKAINDSYGHATGDEFLKQIGERVSQSLRGVDTAARIGGDEFVVLCESLADDADAGIVARRIQDALTADILVQGQAITITASIGIAISDDSSTPDTLLRDSDSAMYVAKRHGGKRWEPANASLHAAALRTLTLGSELREALAQRQLRVHYQPIYDLSTRRLVATEALVRWHHPGRGLLLPGEFLDVAQQRGLIADIGALVLTTACEQAALWARRFGRQAPSVAVNVASPQLGNGELSRLIEKLLVAYGLQPAQLHIEITESQLVNVGTSAVADLRTVSDLGVRIAVDDFGTGFAGFEYLRHLPVHELKVDTSFVAGLNVDPTDTAITTSVIALGRSLGLVVVAEGIEHREQMEALHSLGCPRGQGWFWSKAVPSAQIDQLMQTPPDR